MERVPNQNPFVDWLDEIDNKKRSVDQVSLMILDDCSMFDI